MHELGVVFHVIRQVEEIGVENKLKEVAAVTLQVGEVSGIISSYMTDCWKWAIKKSELLKNAELKIEPIEAVTYCEDCKELFSTVKNGKVCPKCQSENTYLLQGDEFMIKELEAR